MPNIMRTTAWVVLMGVGVAAASAVKASLGATAQRLQCRRCPKLSAAR